ncbi:hypothetical protein Trydic_g11556 [Trypoxylus dichotomus]
MKTSIVFGLLLLITITSSLPYGEHHGGYGGQGHGGGPGGGQGQGHSGGYGPGGGHGQGGGFGGGHGPGGGFGGGQGQGYGQGGHGGYKTHGSYTVLDSLTFGIQSDVILAILAHNVSTITAICLMGAPDIHRLKTNHKNKSAGVKSGDRDGQTMLPFREIRPPRNTFLKTATALRAVWLVAPSC